MVLVRTWVERWSGGVDGELLVDGFFHEEFDLVNSRFKQEHLVDVARFG